MAKLFCSPCFPSLSWQPVNGLDEALGSVSGLCWIYSYSSYLTLLLPSTYPVSLNFRGTQYSWDMLLELLVFRTVGSTEGRWWGKFFFCGFTVIIRERATRTSEKPESTVQENSWCHYCIICSDNNYILPIFPVQEPLPSFSPVTSFSFFNTNAFPWQLGDVISPGSPESCLRLRGWESCLTL